ncbi:ArsR/SmtB family transcription factor [Segnochrobactraceae bacterium EtOH-i3]
MIAPAPPDFSPGPGLCDRDLDRLVVVFKALAHPARLKIVQSLSASRSCTCGDIVRALPLAQSTVSEHLRILKAAGLVRGEIEGPRANYCLDAAAIAALGPLVASLFGTPGPCPVSPDRAPPRHPGPEDL